MKMKVTNGMGGTGSGRYTTREDAKTTCRKQRRAENVKAVREQLKPDAARRVSRRPSPWSHCGPTATRATTFPPYRALWATLEDAQALGRFPYEPWWEPLQVMPAAHANRLPGLNVSSRCFTVK